MTFWPTTHKALLGSCSGTSVGLCKMVFISLHAPPPSSPPLVSQCNPHCVCLLCLLLLLSSYILKLGTVCWDFCLSSEPDFASWLQRPHEPLVRGCFETFQPRPSIRLGHLCLVFFSLFVPRLAVVVCHTPTLPRPRSSGDPQLVSRITGHTTPPQQKPGSEGRRAWLPTHLLRRLCITGACRSSHLLIPILLVS